MSVSHWSRVSFGRAFSAGKEPTMPALHCSITSFGLPAMNIGAPITGMRSFCNIGGRDTAFISVSKSSAERIMRPPQRRAPDRSPEQPHAVRLVRGHLEHHLGRDHLAA